MIKVAILFKLIKEKAKEGVNVYLSVDRINDLSFERKMKNELQENGVHFTYSRKPELPFGFYSLHHRNHRRITTIDGEIGYTGGFNIGDEYLGKISDLDIGVIIMYDLKEKEQKI